MEAAEKCRLTGQIGETRPSGAKARVDFTAVLSGLEPVPFSWRSFSKRSFSAAWVAVALLGMGVAGCGSGTKKPAAGPGAQTMPVRTVAAQMQPRLHTRGKRDIEGKI